ncbi:hypothetical protein [Nonomuraea recticatena]|uniref:hypothetical protein n=1 Tax=Nonomuraea recticatena TaxID=46178 RepID=UPI00360E5A14
MKIEIRIPGSGDYSYASIWTTEGSPGDNVRELRDVDDNLLSLVGRVLQRGCAMVALGQELGATPITQEQAQPAQAAWNGNYEAQAAPAPYQAPAAPYQAPPADAAYGYGGQHQQPAYQQQQQYQAPAPQGPPPA